MRRALTYLSFALLLLATDVCRVAAAPSPGYDGKWSQLMPDGHVLPGCALDPVHRKLYVYGGGNWTFTDDFYEYDLAGGASGPAWRRLPSGARGTPDRLSGHAMAWDSRRGRVLLYGGLGPEVMHSDLWAYDPAAASWSLLQPASGGPGARRFHAAAYDSVSDALLVFGGEVPAVSARQSDLWRLSLATDPPQWTYLPAAGEAPAGQDLAQMFVEATPHRVVLVGGFTQDERDEARVFARSLDGDSTWTRLTGTGIGPRDRRYYPSGYDPVRRRILTLPNPLEKMDRQDAWSFDLAGGTGWREILPPGPALPPHGYAAAQYEAATDRLYGVSGSVLTPEGGAFYEPDVWSLATSGASSWQFLLGADGVVPASRADVACGQDVAGERLYMFGGLSSTQEGYGAYGDVWSLALAGPARWRRESSTAEGPGARWGSCGAFDSRRMRLVVFGGVASGTRVDDAYAFDVGTLAWERLEASGPAPSARFGATAFYDSLADRVLVYGGDDGSSQGDLWSLELSGFPRWRKLAPLGAIAPPGRSYASMAYDPLRDALWIYGGYGNGDELLGDTWRLDLAGDGLWSPAQIPGKLPTARAEAGAAYDPVRDCMVVLWGRDAGGGRRTDTNRFLPRGGPAWEPLAMEGLHPYPRVQPLVVWDAPRDRLVMYGGTTGGYFYSTVGDLWAAEWAAPESPPTAAADAATVTIRPNPCTGQAAIEFVLASAADVGAAIYDTNGRLVRHLPGGPRAPGPVSLGWDGRDDRGVSVPAGVYLSQVNVAGRLTRNKIVLLR